MGAEREDGMNSFSIGGIQIIESPLVGKKPRFTLSEKVQVTPEFRADFNEWARKFFGETDQMLMMVGKCFVSPDVAAKMRQAAKEIL